MTKDGVPALGRWEVRKKERVYMVRLKLLVRTPPVFYTGVRPKRKYTVPGIHGGKR